MNLPIHDRIGPVSTPARVRILYINPNSTLAFTKETVDHLNEQSLLPPDVHIDFYTAPAEHAPPSIDGTLDGVISTAAILRDIGIIQNSQGRIGPIGTKTLEYLASTYTAIVVACFSSHPLVPCLREAFGVLEQSIVPSIVGIMEASIMVGMQMGPAFGIATTGTSWEPLFDEAIRTLGIAPSRYTGTKGSGFNAISLHGDGPFDSLVGASVNLVKRGANVIVLGCAGMAPMRANIEKEVSKQCSKSVVVVDCVQAGLETAISMSRMRK